MKNIEKQKIGDTLIKEYNEGKSCSFLGKKYSISHSTVSKYLKSKGINVVNRQNLQQGLNKRIFENIDNEEKAYWLGFLYADGYISNKTTHISLSLKKSDKVHLEKFKSFLKTSAKISYRKRLKAYRLSFRCKQMREDLIKLGCTPNKSMTISQIPNIPEELKIHFIRGFFDGDGCITYSNERRDSTRLPAINITSNKKMLIAICTYLNEPRTLTPKKGTDVCIIRWSGAKAINILNMMYENSNIHLDRKHLRYKIFKQNNFAVRKSDLPDY
jgi:hypothetical protein